MFGRADGKNLSCESSAFVISPPRLGCKPPYTSATWLTSAGDASASQISPAEAGGRWPGGGTGEKNVRLMRVLLSASQMATCHTCNTTSRHKGTNRAFVASLSTPGSATKRPKTPQSTSRAKTSTPRTPARDKTPVQTPRSVILRAGGINI